jgi:hypothetical protein
VGVPVVGALAVVVGVPVDGDTEGLPGVTVGVPEMDLAVVVWVLVTCLTLGVPGLTAGVPVVAATAM